MLIHALVIYIYKKYIFLYIYNKYMLLLLIYIITHIKKTLCSLLRYI